MPARPRKKPNPYKLLPFQQAIAYMQGWRVGASGAPRPKQAILYKEWEWGFDHGVRDALSAQCKARRRFRWQLKAYEKNRQRLILAKAAADKTIEMTITS